MRILGVVALCVALAGRGLARMQERQEQMQAAVAAKDSGIVACKKQYPDVDTHSERLLQQIAFGYVLTPSGGMRKMYNHEMISLAREAAISLGSLTLTQPFQARSGAAEVDGLTNARVRSRV